MDKQKWLGMPETNIVLLYQTKLQTNLSFLFSFYLSEFSWNKNIISFSTAKIFFISLSK